MKIVLKFKTDNNFIPKDYHRFCIKFFKTAVSNYSNGEFFEKFFGDDYIKSDEKKYSWAVKFFKPKFFSNRIEVGENNFEITFKAPKTDVGTIFFNSFLEYKDKEFKISENNFIVLTDAKIVNEKKIVGNCARFKFCSPLVIREHNREDNTDRHITVEDKDFFDKFKENLKIHFPNYSNSIDNMKIDISVMKKAVVLFYGLYIDVSLGVIVIKADNSLLNEMLISSVGSKNASGFGLLQLIESWEMK